MVYALATLPYGCKNTNKNTTESKEPVLELKDTASAVSLELQKTTDGTLSTQESRSEITRPQNTAAIEKEPEQIAKQPESKAKQTAATKTPTTKTVEQPVAKTTETKKVEPAPKPVSQPEAKKTTELVTNPAPPLKTETAPPKTEPTAPKTETAPPIITEPKQPAPEIKKEQESKPAPPKAAQQPSNWPVPESYNNKPNPVKADNNSIKAGKTLYTKHCASCHGKSGLGDGTKAAQLNTFSGDFTSTAFQNQTDGALFYKTVQGRDEMPNYKKKIPEEEDIWNLVNYMRTFK